MMLFHFGSGQRRLSTRNEYQVVTFNDYVCNDNIDGFHGACFTSRGQESGSAFSAPV